MRNAGCEGNGCCCLRQTDNPLAECLLYLVFTVLDSDDVVVVVFPFFFWYLLLWTALDLFRVGHKKKGSIAFAFLLNELFVPFFFFLLNCFTCFAYLFHCSLACIFCLCFV